MIFIFLFVVIFLGILFVAARTIHTWEIQQENEMIQSYMTSMGELYVGIQNRIRATRRYRHDLAKHIQTLQRLLGQREGREEIVPYMDSLTQEYQKLKGHVLCTDEIVNAILDIKQAQCEKQGIPFEIQVEDCIYQEIDETDMVCLLYNCLDNALEANERIPEGSPKGMGVSLSKKDGKIFLEVWNCIPPGEHISFRTAKAGKDQHGIGLKIIGKMVGKYHGTQEYYCDKNAWKLFCKITLNIGKLP